MYAGYLNCAAAVIAAAITTTATAEVRTVWTKTYNGPGNHSDTDPAVIVDSAGRVYVAGSAYDPGTGSYTLAVVQYSASGELVWERFTAAAGTHDSSPGLALDLDGNVVVTGRAPGTPPAAVVRKYSPAGDLLADVRHPVGPTACGGTTRCPRLAIDGANNICIAWTSACDFWVAKFTPNGGFLWEYTWGAAGELDEATGVAADAAGHVFAVGTLNDAMGGYGVLALTAGGTFLWSDHESGAIGSSIGPALVEVDAGGNVIVAANPETGCGLPEIRVWKYSPAGVRQWTRSYPDAPCDSGTVTALAIDRQGNPIVTGQVGVTADYVTVKYDPQGHRLWARQHDGALGSSDFALAVALDEQDRVYVTGFEILAGGQTDLATVAYSPAGDELWVRKINLSTNDRGTGIAANRFGVVVAGSFWAAATNDDFVVRKYFMDQAGDLNCDSTVDFGDINPFVLALTNAAGYAAAYPGCNLANADINGNNQVGFDDINPFVALLTGR